jgi:Na+/melibiose symporter-like transporter
MLTGILTAGAIPALAAANGFGERQAVSLIGWVTIIIGAILFAFLLFGVQEPKRRPLHRREDPLRAIKGLSGNRPFQFLLCGWFINGLANGIPAVLFILYMKHVLEANELERGLLTLTYFIAGVLGIPVWVWLSKRLDKQKTWSIAMTLACISFAFVPLLGSGDIIQFFFITIITGITLGADLIIPPSMQADVAEFEYFRSRHDRTSLLFACWSMATKFAIALSVLIAFLLLEAFDFTPSLLDAKSNIVALAVIYAGLPIVFKLSSILIISLYPLTLHRQSLVRRRLVSLEARLER